MQIENLKIEMASEFCERASVQCEADGARFHYWIVKDDSEWHVESGVVYKNPLDSGPEAHREGRFFRTRQLTRSTGIGKQVFDATWDDAQKMIPAAIAAQEAKNDQEAAARKQRMRTNAINERAGAMYALLAVDPATIGGPLWLARRDALFAEIEGVV